MNNIRNKRGLFIFPFDEFETERLEQENYQIVNGEKRHFDDREIVRKYLSELEIR